MTTSPSPDPVVLGAVGNVFYFVSDLTAAVDWYADLLGRRPVAEQPQLAVFEVGGVRLTVHVDDEFDSSGQTAGTVPYWDVADVDEAVRRCVARGAVAHRGPKTVFSGERLCQLRDPFGNLLGLRQPPAA